MKEKFVGVKEKENMPPTKYETTLFLWSSFLLQRKVETWFESTRGLTQRKPGFFSKGFFLKEKFDEKI